MFHRNSKNNNAHADAHYDSRQHMWTSSKEVTDADLRDNRDARDRDWNDSRTEFRGNDNARRQGGFFQRFMPGRNHHNNNNFQNQQYAQQQPQQYSDWNQSTLNRDYERYQNRNGRDFSDRLDGGVTRNVHTETSYGYGHPSTRSDWDHYAVRHEDALIGDPIPYADNSLRGEIIRDGRSWNNTGYANNSNFDNRNRTYVYDDSTNKRGHGNNKRNETRILEGPVAFDAPFDAQGRPLRGNYATGSVIEDGINWTRNQYGWNRPGYFEQRFDGEVSDFDRSRTNNKGWALGSEPLYGNNAPLGNGWRDIRDNRTPLLPENPWTHNELGREYLDGREGHLYKHTDDGFVYSNDRKNKRQPISAHHEANNYYYDNNMNRNYNGSLNNNNYYDNNTNFNRNGQRETTRHLPGAFVNSTSSTTSNIPVPPPAPQWNTRKSNFLGNRKLRGFTNNRTDYSTFDPRTSYLQTRAPLPVTADVTTIQSGSTTTVTDTLPAKTLPTTQPILNNTFNTTKAN